MKKITTFFFIAILGLIFTQLATAQTAPSFSKKYSDTEIEKMIASYKATHEKDIYPSDLLKQQLAKDFPNARDIEWETGANIYEANFEIGRTDYKAYYDEQANLLVYLVELKTRALPAIIKNAAQVKYPNYKFEDASKIVCGSGVLYKVEMEKGEKEVKTIFRENGTFYKEIFN